MNLLEQLVVQHVALIVVTHDPVIGGRAQRQLHMVDGQIISETGQVVGRAMPAETERRAEPDLR
jgi:ABC-type lipoprotein export system ATPase subunit